ncbi:flagellar biosynthetic protein FliO [Dehalobacter sp. DCM]|uniref:FliO/MopB family protein n=1 Tax=Dehalobacter sp. DCM TaxID=2907827 RepID=UPI00308187BA|nr:flagellar biosynthetic protein FliO [Dehalobacter sp. DCM]
MNGIESQPYNPTTPTTAAAPETISWAGTIGTIVVFLIILLVALWMIKKLNRYSVRNIESSWVRVLDRQVLGGQQTLYLVEIAGKIQVLGGTDHHISKVAEIDDVDVAAEILDEIARQPQEKMDRFLSGVMNKFRRKGKGNSFSAELERYLEEERK